MARTMPGTTNGAIARNARMRAPGTSRRVLAYDVITASTDTIVAAAAAYSKLCWMAARAVWLSTMAQRYQSRVRFPGTGPTPHAFESEVASSAPYGSTSDNNGGI